MKTHKNLVILNFIILLSLFSCREEDVFPKPKNYLRIELPKHKYKEFNDSCNFKFQYSEYSKVITKPNSPTESCFKNIIYPKFKAALYCTYVNLNSNLFQYTEYSRKLAYEHTIKSIGIEEVKLENKEKNVYGTSFEIKGNVACNYLFYLTDSSSNYFAGSLYFETFPNYDSLQPIIKYVIKDIEHLINTFEWKK